MRTSLSGDSFTKHCTEGVINASPTNLALTKSGENSWELGVVSVDGLYGLNVITALVIRVISRANNSACIEETVIQIIVHFLCVQRPYCEPPQNKLVNVRGIQSVRTRREIDI